MDNDRVAVHAHISGQVQGVNYRAWTRSEAVRMGLAGWVRNEPDGTVSAMIAGRHSDVAAMTDKLWDGPPPASVSNVTTEEANPDPWPSDFNILR